MTSLRSTIRPGTIQLFHAEKIALIDATDFSGVRRKTREGFVERGILVDENYLNEGILALKQYYAIAILDPLNMHVVSDKVDPFWHAHILHTEEYVDFCNRTVGSYMHHSPLDHGRPKHVEGVNRLYRYTAKCFRHFFAYVNLEFFPMELKEDNLICVHFGNTYHSEVGQNALLPHDAAMQREMTLPA